MQIIHYHFDWIDSTNTWAKEHAHEFLPGAMVIVTANGQTAGRGRFNRPWASPYKQNIYATFCFFVDKKRGDMGHIPQVLALSVTSILNNFNIDARLKWPNDVMVSQKKIAGILSETVMVEDHLCFILGIGLNINMSLEELNRVDQPATSILSERQLQNKHLRHAINAIDVKHVFSSLQHKFIEDYTLFVKQGMAPFSQMMTFKLL